MGAATLKLVSLSSQLGVGGGEEAGVLGQQLLEWGVGVEEVNKVLGDQFMEGFLSQIKDFVDGVGRNGEPMELNDGGDDMLRTWQLKFGHSGAYPGLR